LSNPTGPNDVFTIFATAITAVAARVENTPRRQSSSSAFRVPTSSPSTSSATDERSPDRFVRFFPNRRNSTPILFLAVVRRRRPSPLVAFVCRTVRLSHIDPGRSFAKEHVRSRHRARARV